MEVGFCLTGSDRGVRGDKGLTPGEHAEKAPPGPLTTPLSRGLSPAVGFESAKFMTFQREVIVGGGWGGEGGGPETPNPSTAR